MQFPKWMNWRRFIVLSVLLLLASLAANGVGTAQAHQFWNTVTTGGNNGSPGHQPVGICHHTGNSQAHEWVYITPDASGVWDGHAKGGHQDFYGPEDIIPPFTFTDSQGVTHTYPGQNLDTHYDASLEPTPGGPYTGRQILDNHCQAPSGTTTGTTSTGTTSTTNTTTGSTTTTPSKYNVYVTKRCKDVPGAQMDCPSGLFPFTLTCTGQAAQQQVLWVNNPQFVGSCPTTSGWQVCEPATVGNWKNDGASCVSGGPRSSDVTMTFVNQEIGSPGTTTNVTTNVTTTNVTTTNVTNTVTNTVTQTTPAPPAPPAQTVTVTQTVTLPASTTPGQTTTTTRTKVVKVCYRVGKNGKRTKVSCKAKPHKPVKHHKKVCTKMVKHHRVRVSCTHKPHKVPVHGRHTTAVPHNRR